MAKQVQLDDTVIDGDDVCFVLDQHSYN